MGAFGTLRSVLHDPDEPVNAAQWNAGTAKSENAPRWWGVCNLS